MKQERRIMMCLLEVASVSWFRNKMGFKRAFSDCIDLSPAVKKHDFSRTLSFTEESRP